MSYDYYTVGAERERKESLQKSLQPPPPTYNYQQQNIQSDYQFRFNNCRCGQCQACRDRLSRQTVRRSDAVDTILSIPIVLIGFVFLWFAIGIPLYFIAMAFNYLTGG